jgi:hypothetical protein
MRCWEKMIREDERKVLMWLAARDLAVEKSDAL